MTPSRGPFVELRTNWHRTSAGRPHRTPVSSSRYSGQSRKITGPLISTSPPRCSRPARMSPAGRRKQGQISRSLQAPPRACGPQGTTHGCRWPASHVEAVWRRLLRRGLGDGFSSAAAPGPGPARHFDYRADHERDTQRQQQAGPRPVCESLPAQPADEEGVTRPQHRCDGGRGDEAAPPVADQAAAQRDSGPPAGDEPAADDDPGTETAERPLGPRTPALPPLPREDPGRPELGPKRRPSR